MITTGNTYYFFTRFAVFLIVFTYLIIINMIFCYLQLPNVKNPVEHVNYTMKILVTCENLIVCRF